MSQKRREFVAVGERLVSARGLSGARHRALDRHIWRNGTVVRRKDGTVNIVPPLEPLAVRTISRQQEDEAGSGTVTAL